MSKRRGYVAVTNFPRSLLLIEVSIWLDQTDNQSSISAQFPSHISTNMQNDHHNLSSPHHTVLSQECDVGIKMQRTLAQNRRGSALLISICAPHNVNISLTQFIHPSIHPSILSSTQLTKAQHKLVNAKDGNRSSST